MSSLPLEIVQQIADWVETMHRPSLFAFSLASKACYRATLFLAFRKLKITIQDYERLQRGTGRLAEALYRTDSARHVQSITIKGALCSKPKKTGMDELFSPPRWYDDPILDDEEIAHGTLYVVYDEAVIKESSSEDMAWAPLVKLLEATTGLRDLTYDCQSQFPPSLLRALHKQHPLCRLHHLTFRFGTLLWGIPYPYEMELATSPSLYKVRVICTDQDSDGDFDYNMDAVMELAAGLAPNLKEVSIANTISQLASSRRSIPRQLWQGLSGFSGAATGSLTSLSLYYCANATLHRWARHTDFDKLQHLLLGGGTERRSCGITGEEMERIARNIRFPNLETLFINVSRNDDRGEKPHYSENAISFFRSLKPLKELTINGPLDPEMIEAILTHHGPTLKKLGLEPSEATNLTRARRKVPMKFTEEQILQIQALCPILEKLAITIMRDKSSASETAVYRAFGKMVNLRYLFLTLSCANWRCGCESAYDAGFEGDDQLVFQGYQHDLDVKRGDIRETLINSAVDEALARSIWQVITEHKTGKQLQRLKLWTRDGETFSYSGMGALSAYANDMNRSWLVERSPRDDTEDVTVEELLKQAREEYENRFGGGGNGVVGQIFRSIWPSKPGGKIWRDDWSSFPLQG